MPLEVINLTIGVVFFVVWILVSRILVRQHTTQIAPRPHVRFDKRRPARFDAPAAKTRAS